MSQCAVYRIGANDLEDEVVSAFISGNMPYLDARKVLTEKTIPRMRNSTADSYVMRIVRERDLDPGSKILNGVATRP